MSTKLNKLLKQFAGENGFSNKGALCVALVVTRRARTNGLPLDPKSFITAHGGQVAGLGRAGVQAILKDYKIDRILAAEGGRTNRGAIGQMQAYVALLNSLPASIDLTDVEKFWITEVQRFFAGKPFKLQVDLSLSIRAAVANLLSQARQRQTNVHGSRYEGAMLQHLIGAKLDLVLGPQAVSHHSTSEADQADGRAGDFVIGDVAIHATTAPSEGLLQKCRENLNHGLQPLIITLPKKTAVADGIAENLGIAQRVEILDIEQFLAANLHERSLFKAANRRPRTLDLIERYNELVAKFEKDPALRIETN